MPARLIRIAVVSVGAALSLSTLSAAQGACNEGCTPGYWKNHVERWDGQGGDDFTQSVVASLSFNAAFGVGSADSGFANSESLVDVMRTGGGGLVALGRHAAAALASADAVCYALTVGEVIDAYRGAVLGGSVSGAHQLFEGYNQSGCPLSNSTPPPPPRIFCVGDQGDCPCANEGVLGGCLNSSGSGARIDTRGSSSVTADDLEIVGTQFPANTSVLFLMADAQRRSPFLDGLLCIGGPTSKIYRLPPIFSSGATGAATYGPGLVAASNTPLVPVPGGIRAGETWYLQAYFRDTSSCGNGANTSNGVSVTFTP